MQDWLTHRRRLAATTHRYEDTLFRAHIYTDDPIFMIVGLRRTLRALCLWREITARYQLIMAIPQKRKIGTMVTWLGFLPSPMHGFVAVQRSKLLRAMVALKAAVEGRLPFDRYRSLMGFLEHLKIMVDRPRLRMAALYRPMLAGHEASLGPATLVVPDQDMLDSLHGWLQALGSLSLIHI